MKDSYLVDFITCIKNAISKLVTDFFFLISDNSALKASNNSSPRKDGFISRKIESNWIVGHNTLVPHKDKGGFELPLGEQMGFY